MRLSLSRSVANSPEWLESQLEDKLRRIAASLRNTDAPVDVILVDDEYIRRINREYRGIDRPTDVISFSYSEDADHVPPDQDLAGEIYVSFETLEREANTQGIEVGNLFLRMGVHGLLHVLGYEHETESDQKSMEREERRLLLSELGHSEVERLF